MGPICKTHDDNRIDMEPWNGGDCTSALRPPRSVPHSWYRCVVLVSKDLGFGALLWQLLGVPVSQSARIFALPPGTVAGIPPFCFRSPGSLISDIRFSSMQISLERENSAHPPPQAGDTGSNCADPKSTNPLVGLFAHHSCNTTCLWSAAGSLFPTPGSLFSTPDHCREAGVATPPL